MSNVRAIRASDVIRDQAAFIAQCRENGAITKFELVLRSMNPRPPRDMGAYFALFVAELDTILVPKQLLFKWREHFGARVEFLRAFGIVMILCRDEAVHFLTSKELDVTRPRHRLPSLPQNGGVRDVRMGLAPESSKIFQQALATQSIRPYRWSK